MLHRFTFRKMFSINPFHDTGLFLSPLKYKNTSDFLMVSGCIEKKQKQPFADTFQNRCS